LSGSEDSLSPEPQTVSRQLPPVPVESARDVSGMNAAIYDEPQPQEPFTSAEALAANAPYSELSAARDTAPRPFVYDTLATHLYYNSGI